MQEKFGQHLREEDEDAGRFALALPVDLTPPLVLTYSGRSEDQHFSFFRK